MYSRKLHVNKYRSTLILQPTNYKHVHVTNGKLHIELHGINELRCSQIDRVREILKLTYDRVQQGE